MRHRNRITKYKAKINTFRVSELQEFLAFVHLSNEGNKNVLRDRAWKSLKKELYLNENIDPELNKKIQELFERAKVPFKKRSECFAWPLEINNFLFFDDLDVIIPGQKFNFVQEKQTIDFIISESLIGQVVSGLQADCTYGNEIQLRVWRYLNNREEGSENIYLCVELNGKPRYVHQPSPNFIYITSDCVLEPNVRNRISISSPRREILQNYAFGLALVKRIFPEEVLEKYPLRRTDDTLMLVKQKMEELEVRKYEVFTICPMSKELIKQPCRGVMCQHPEVFDAVSFLDKMQYHLNWRCPICQKELMYRDLLLETYFREVCDNRSLVYAFWNKRETTKLPDMTSSGEISLVSEIITLE